MSETTTVVVEKPHMVVALEKLNQFDVEDFYTCSIGFGSVKLQGHATKASIQKYIDLGFVFEVTKDWLKAEKDNIQMVLTYKH
jgi:hypothetical protein